MGFETPITIEKIIQGIQENKYVLPAIQREFVWDEEQIQKLFDSLMRGYPIGSFLFWKINSTNLSDFQFYCFMDRYHERDYHRNQPIELIGSNNTTAVLDGQQRLTALNIGLKGWYASKMPYYKWNSDYAFPQKRLFVNLIEPPKESEYAFEFKMLQEKEVQKKDPSKHWFLVGDILKFQDMQSVFFYCVENGLTSDKKTFPSNTLMELWRIIKEKPLINFFLEEEQNLDKVLNIFIRVNSGGTILSYSDMLLSIATAAWEKMDARVEIYSLVDELNNIGEGFFFSKDFILKSCLVLSDIVNTEFRVNNFTKENMLKIEGDWEDISKALKITTHLISSWGYSSQTLTTAYATIPLAYYIKKCGGPTNFSNIVEFEKDRELMRKWLQIAILKRTFSGQPDSVLRPVRKVIQDNSGFPFNQIIEELKSSSKSMKFDLSEIDGLLSYKYTQGYVFTVLSILYPWLKYDQQFHIDHIFPKSMFNAKELRSRGIPEDQWYLWLDHFNDLPNLQLLQGLVNMSKSDQEFESWLKGECESPKDLAGYKQNHLIPNVELNFENFPEFLKEREKLLRIQFANIFNVEVNNNNIK
jgi:uncharacterized protein with ParB-like and HNH nuclease domain